MAKKSSVSSDSRSNKNILKLYSSLSSFSEGSFLASDSEKINSYSKFRISTGCLAVDLLLGGGFPTGKVVEVYGMPAEGKSSLAESCVVQTQKMGGLVAWILSEPNLSRDRLSRQGADLEKIAVTEPDSAENAVKAILAFVSQKTKVCPSEPGLVVWDTIASCPTLKEKAAVLEGKPIAVMERYKTIKGLFNALVMPLAESNTCLLIVNQTIGSPVPFKRPDTGSGYSLKYHSRVRLLIKRKKSYQVDGKEDGILSNVKVMKSQTDNCIPETSSLVYIGYNRGIDDAYSTFYNLFDKKYITFDNDTYTLAHADGIVEFKWNQIGEVFNRETMNPSILALLKDVITKEKIEASAADEVIISENEVTDVSQ